MSNALAIAAVTATLKYMINDRLAGQDLSTMGTVSVTAMPPDRVETGPNEPDQLNLFLYQITPNLGWRNWDLPTRDAAGNKVANSPLALDLHYILTAYGSKDFNAEILLGYAMQILHETPMLTRSQLTSALTSTPLVDGTILPSPFGSESAADLANQIEQIKISPVFLTTEDLSKMWTAMQARYRPTMAYMVSVILITATDSIRSNAPVLKIGPDGMGPAVAAGGVPSLATVQTLSTPPMPAMRLNDLLILTGSNIANQGPVVAVFAQPEAGLTQQLPTAVGPAPGSLTVQLPSGGDSPAQWASGTYNVNLQISNPPTPTWNTNTIPIALAPTITINPLTALAGNITLNIDCTPQLLPAQATRVLLLFGSQSVSPTSVTTPPDPTKPTSLVFDIPSVIAGTYLVRLRVDGVDSIPIVIKGTPPAPTFDPSQMVTVS